MKNLKTFMLKYMYGTVLQMFYFFFKRRDSKQRALKKLGSFKFQSDRILRLWLETRKLNFKMLVLMIKSMDNINN